jgi:hypothetical protein
MAPFTSRRTSAETTGRLTRIADAILKPWSGDSGPGVTVAEGFMEVGYQGVDWSWTNAGRAPFPFKPPLALLGAVIGFGICIPAIVGGLAAGAVGMLLHGPALATAAVARAVDRQTQGRRRDRSGVNGGNPFGSGRGTMDQSRPVQMSAPEVRGTVPNLTLPTSGPNRGPGRSLRG